MNACMRAYVHTVFHRTTQQRCLQVYKQLTDPSFPLPWEPGRISQSDKEKLGRFHRAIMKLLHRDPCMRATARQFCDDMRHVFAKKSTTSHTQTSSRRDEAQHNGASPIVRGGVTGQNNNNGAAVTTDQYTSSGSLVPSNKVSTGGKLSTVSNEQSSAADTELNLLAAAVESTHVHEQGLLAAVAPTTIEPSECSLSTSFTDVRLHAVVGAHVTK